MRLRIEEDNRNSEKRAGKHPMESKANVVEHASKTKKQKSSGESSSQGSKGGKIKSKSLMANVTSVTKRDIGPKIAVAKANTKEEQARSLLKPT
mgnify:CR=1 FL=1